MMTSSRNIKGKGNQMALTRIEVAFCLGALAMLACVAIPGLADTRSRTQRAGCVENLRLIGQGVQLWGADHDEKPPWQTYINAGGTEVITGNPKPPTLWYEIAWMSNQLVTPKILACPSDPIASKRIAQNWGVSIDGGYRNAAYRNSATSYLLNLHSYLGNPKSFIFGDRNMRVDSPNGVNCSLGYNNVASIFPSPISNVAWTNNLHGVTGNFLTADGSVLEVPDATLKGYLGTLSNNDNGSLHLLVP
jgi:competence protein ComGC